MNVLVFGAGASHATHNLPTAAEALARWKEDIRRSRPLLALALNTWIGSDWPNQDLETAWTRIDLAWKQREGQPGPRSTPDLTSQDRQEVRRLAREAADKEPVGAISPLTAV